MTDNGPLYGMTIHVPSISSLSPSPRKQCGHCLILLLETRGKCRSADTLTHAALIVCIESPCPAPSQMVIDSSLVPVVILALKQGDFRTQKEAAWAVSNFTVGGTQEQVYMTGAWVIV